MGYGRKLNRKAKIIAINRSKDQLLLNSGMFWTPSVAALGDVGSFIVNVAERLRGYQAPADWLETLRARDTKKEQTIEAKGTKPTQFINPIYLHQVLDKVMSDDSIIVADGGDFVGTAAYILRPRGPLRWLDPGAFGTLGVGGGFALGAKLCRPSAEVSGGGEEKRSGGLRWKKRDSSDWECLFLGLGCLWRRQCWVQSGGV